MPSTDAGMVEGEVTWEPDGELVPVEPPVVGGAGGRAASRWCRPARRRRSDELQPAVARRATRATAPRRVTGPAEGAGRDGHPGRLYDHRCAATVPGMTDGTYSVAELVEGVRDAVAARFAEPVWVHGEISGIKRGRNGHVWFDLVDRDDAGTVSASIPVVLWSSVRVGVNAQLKRAGSIRMDDGVRIRIMGPLDVWVTGGRLQLQMQGIDPSYTLGLLATERDRVLRLLEAEGLLGRNRALVLPTVPRRIGLVTAVGSAAEADFLQTLADSPLAWEVVLVDARVQGTGSERSVAAALLAAAGAGVDLIALVRGGGARTDLATFDHELVARTIASLDVPVLTGIGHEIDTSVADVGRPRRPQDPHRVRHGRGRPGPHRRRPGRAGLARHRRPSPSASPPSRPTASRPGPPAPPGACGPVWPSRTTAPTRRPSASDGPGPTPSCAPRAAIERRAGRAEGTARAHLRVHERSLDAARRRAPRRWPAPPCAGPSSTWPSTGTRLSALDPARALARGWSITRTTAGSVVRRSTDVGPGDTLVTTLADGTVTSTVAAVAPGEDQPDAV